MKRFLPLLALLPALAFGHDDDPPAYPAGHNPNHEFTADLSVVTGLENPVQGWPVVRLISRGVGGGPVIRDQGFGRPRTLPVSGGQVRVDRLMASEAYAREQEYVLVVGSTPYVFVMPNAPSSFAATRVPVGETGPVTISSDPDGPLHPSPGDIAFNPTGLTPGEYSHGLNIREGGGWHQVQGGEGGAGLNQTQVDARVVAGVKPFARTGGDPIALGDTGFGDDVIDAIDRSRSSYTPGTRTIVLENRDGTPVDGFPLVIPEGGSAYDDGPLTARVEGVEAFEATMRRKRDVGSSTITEGLSNVLVSAGYRLPLDAGDRVVVVTVDSGAEQMFPLARLLALSRAGAPTQADDSNSVPLTLPDGDVLRFALAGDGTLSIADDTVASRHTVAVALDEPDVVAPQALQSSTERWPASKVPVPPAVNLSLGTLTATTYPIDNDRGDGVILRGASGSAAGVMVATDKAKLDRYPAGCPTGQRLSGSGTGPGQGFSCAPDATGAQGRGITLDDARALIKLPAREGNTANRFGRGELPSDVLYDDAHKDSVFGAFRGTDTSTDSNTIFVQASYTADPSLSTLRSIPDSDWVSAQEVGPRFTNVWMAIRVPSGEDADVQAGRRAFDVTESRGVFERYPSDGWNRKGTNVTGTQVFYTVQVADLPSGAMYLVRAQADLRLNARLIDVGQWRAALGTVGITLDELDRTQQVANAGSDAIPTAPYYYDEIDLDTHTHGEIHVSLHANITNVSSGNPNFAWYANRANATLADRERVGSVTIFLSDLLQEPEYVANSDPSQVDGIEALTWPGFTAGTENGDFVVKLVRDTVSGVKRMGSYVYWEGENGSHSFHVPYELRIAVTPTDGETLADLGGLNQSAVDARVVAGTLPEARAGNTAAWSATKAPGTYSTPAEVKAAYEGNANTNAYTSLDRVKVGRWPTAACPLNQIPKSNGTVFTCQADATGGGGGTYTPTRRVIYLTNPTQSDQSTGSITLTDGSVTEFPAAGIGTGAVDWSAPVAADRGKTLICYYAGGTASNRTYSAADRYPRTVISMSVDEWLDAPTATGNYATPDLLPVGWFSPTIRAFGGDGWTRQGVFTKGGNSRPAFYQYRTGIMDISYVRCEIIG